MDDRDSLYFDTISLAGSEAANNRRSLSQSRMTIYHSAVDLAYDGTPKRNSRGLDKNGLANYRNSAAAALTTAIGNGDGSNTYMDQSNIAANNNGLNDEVSSRLIPSSSCNKDKKLPITYSQWKFRTRRRFQDGERSVDFVLAFNGDDTSTDNEIKRNIFETNLEKEGLQLERDKTQRIHFVKVHAPLEVLSRYSEILKIKLPMKWLKGQSEVTDHSFQLMETIKSLFGWCCTSVELDTSKFPPREQRIYCEFSRNYLHLFDWERPNFFDATVRNSIINFILERQHFVEGEETPDNLGIEKLIADRVYDAAYPLHDDNDKDLLLSEWATVRKWMDHQPLDSVREYFGPKVALYYAWLGFYTHMLIPVSIIGILCFVYGFATWSSDTISNEICSANKTTLMCPQCDKRCDYWKLQDTCNSSKMNYLIDNNVTVVFAFVMSVWAVLYLELWKRYSTRLMHQWGLIGFSQEIEHPRPQYLAKLRRARLTKLKMINNVLEPDVPFWRTKFLSDLTSYSIMILFICVSIIAFFSLIVYRMAQRASHSILGNEDTATYKIMVLPLTAGIIDLTVISLLDYAYSYLAIFLTNLEYRRTQTEYDESLTIKNYVFQFVNYYTSLFYIAFLKGKFVGYPKKYNRIFGFRQEECAPGGCLMELCMQLVIIMVGKQAVNAIIEMLIPYAMNAYKKLQTSFGVKRRRSEEKLIACNQWTEDYHLMPWTHSSLYFEYLEMVLQFGFITLFGLAFPLAPLLALINNVIEMRLDAFKMLKFFKRPVAQRVRNIGVWYNIMSIISKIAVASSAMIIAFSTNLIPKLVYKVTTHDNSLEGYLNFTLAHFNTEDFQIQPETSLFGNVTTCRYTEFRNPPWSDEPYKRPLIYWRILAARLAFIVVFQNIVGMIQALVAWSIPDVPGKLRKQIKREDFLLRENIIEYEKKIAAELASQARNSQLPSDKNTTPLLNQRKNSLDTDVLRRRHNNANDDNNDDQTTSV
ncbi:anoctamin-6 isoform X2 [Episyrphus balteatus]|nr:anoctamin-6 isoform X2 [Episyrphus balteatus]